MKGPSNPNWKGGISFNTSKYRKDYQARNPEKAAAHRAVERAIRSGRLARLNCETCGASGTQAHHDDYSKQLDVRWLCRPCHREWHKRSGSPMGVQAIPGGVKEAAGVDPAEAARLRRAGWFLWRGRWRER